MSTTLEEQKKPVQEIVASLRRDTKCRGSGKTCYLDFDAKEAAATIEQLQDELQTFKGDRWTNAEIVRAEYEGLELAKDLEISQLQARNKDLVEKLGSYGWCAKCEQKCVSAGASGETFVGGHPVLQEASWWQCPKCGEQYPD